MWFPFNIRRAFSVLFLSLLICENAKTDGGFSGGGGSTIVGETVDTYLSHHKATHAEMIQLQQRVRNQLSDIQSKLPEFAAELRKGFGDLDWYYVDVPLTQLPFSRTKLPLAIKNAAIQIEDNVFLQKRDCANLAKRPGELETLIMHELVRRIFLAAEGTNTAVTEGSVYKATELLMHSKELSSQELRDQLTTLGYQTKNIVYKNKVENVVNRNPVTMPDAVVVSVPLSGRLTIQQAREGVTACLYGAKKDSFSYGHSDTPSLARDLSYAIGGDPKSFSMKGTSLKVDDWWGLKFAFGSDSRAYPIAEAMPSLIPTKGVECSQVFSEKAENQGQGEFCSYIVDGKFKYASLEINDALIGPKNRDLGELNLVPEGGLPQIEYQGAINEPVYTPFGLTNTDRHIESISIVANRNWVEGDGMVSLQNADTGVTIPVQINGKAYVNCLKEKLTEASKQDPQFSRPLPAAVTDDKSVKRAPPAAEGVIETKQGERAIDAK